MPAWSELTKKRVVQPEFVARQYEAADSAEHVIASSQVKFGPSAPLANEHAEARTKQAQARQNGFGVTAAGRSNECPSCNARFRDEGSPLSSQAAASPAKAAELRVSLRASFLGSAEPWRS